MKQKSLYESYDDRRSFSLVAIYTKLGWDKSYGLSRLKILVSGPISTVVLKREYSSLVLSEQWFSNENTRIWSYQHSGSQTKILGLWSYQHSGSQTKILVSVPIITVVLNR
ncbi:hypothetical protein RRG08_013895 [Elysia crispata]|uniref:Uncharacterized protein n=1 Tax=Elysia crispata TaxID=231223 RepID=A0AAE1DGF2_9GAST|nr:hypothetical protein RRG08_013895 [Elysia crispata]